jgi:hypothetical protein
MGLVGATETQEGSLMGQESELDPERIRRCVGQSGDDRERAVHPDGYLIRFLPGCTAQASELLSSLSPFNVVD